MVSPLTPNAIVALNVGEVDAHPVLQVLDVKQIGNGQSVQERYRLLLSDGCYMQQAMLATQLNEHVKSGQVQKGSIVKLVEYICNTIQQRKIIIVLNMTVVASVSEIIGQPTSITDIDVNQHQHRRNNMQPNGISQPLHQTFNGNNLANVGTIKGGNSLSTGDGLGTHARIQPKTHNFNGQRSSHITPAYPNQGLVTRNEGPARVVPIAALNPYQGRWTIKARVTSKGDLRTYHNAKGEGKVFSFDVLDAEGGEIRVACFNAVADKFYEFIEVGSVYMISKGSLKPAQKSFNHLRSDWEIFLDGASTVELCSDEDGSIPQQYFDFKRINEIEHMEAHAMVDVLGIVVSISPPTSVTRKTGTEVQRRNLQLCDVSGCSVELTMWGAFCNNEGHQIQELCDSGHFPVVAVKGSRISDFGGKSIGTVSSSQVLINPNIHQALSLKDWFDKIGKSSAPISISKDNGNAPRLDMRKTVSQIKDDGLGKLEKPDWVALRGTITFIKTESFCYTACPLTVGDRQCNKKVVNNGDGTWRCDRCDMAVSECDYRYLLAVQVQDHTGITWITAFQEAGEEIMGVSAKELYIWKREDSPRFKGFINGLLFTKHMFKLKVKEENYNDELRLKCTVVKTTKLDYVVESKAIIDMIGRLSRGDFSIRGAVASSVTGVFSASGNASNAGFRGNVQIGLINKGYSGESVNFGPTVLGGYIDGSHYQQRSLTCFKCGGSHNAINCPNEMPVGQQFGHSDGCYNGCRPIGGPTGCFKCGQGGHWARDCPGIAVTGTGYRNYTSYPGNTGYARRF